MKQQFLENKSGTFQTYVYKNNRKAVPESASITVYRPGSGSKLVDSAAMTIGPDGLLSYVLGPAENSTAATNYKAVISYELDSTPYWVTLFYDVVKSRLVKVITDEDITGELPQLKDNGWKVTGTAEGGSTTSIIDSELKRFEDDYFTGGLACSLEKDETREITGFDSSSGTVSTTAFSGAVTTDRYVLARSYTREIQRAFEKIEEKLNRSGRRPQLVLDPYDLREVHIYYSVAEACKGLAADGASFWWEMWKDYEAKAEELFSSMSFKYDHSGDGYIAGAEENEAVTTLRAKRS